MLTRRKSDESGHVDGALVDLPLPPPGLLANDVDPDGDSFVVTSFTQQSSGRITSIVTTGRFSYQPDPGPAARTC